jgi:hypothetical protein
MSPARISILIAVLCTATGLVSQSAHAAAAAAAAAAAKPTIVLFIADD